MKRIAYVSSALTPNTIAGARESFDFFALLLTNIVAQARASDFDVTLYIPEREGVANSQEAILQHVFNQHDQFEAIVIAPFSSEKVLEALIKAHTDRTSAPKGKGTWPPILCVDKAIPSEKVKGVLSANHKLYNVICDNENGGELAAGILHESFQGRRIPAENRRFLILRGLEGSEERIKGFTKELIRLGYAPELIKETREINFTRARANDFVSHQLLAAFESDATSVFHSDKPETRWGIFACNDEMAIGARAAIFSLHAQAREELTKVAAGNSTLLIGDGVRDLPGLSSRIELLEGLRIVGFDGISEITDYINASDPWIIGTIDADVGGQAKDLIQLLNQKVVPTDILRRNPKRIPAR